MKEVNVPFAEQYMQKNRAHRRWKKVLMCLASVVVFCTTYALILPAITMEHCTLTEHTHSTACYTQLTEIQGQELVCAVSGTVIHTHDSRCYDDNGVLRCTLTELEAHTHSDECYTSEPVHTHGPECMSREQGELICTLEEGEDHTHDDDCYDWTEVLTCQLSTEPGEPVLSCGKQEVIAHQHIDDCYEEDEDGNKTLICTQPEVLTHQHDDSCFVTVRIPQDTETLTCTNTDEDHVHTQRCYGTWVLNCTMQEHIHDENCTPKEDEQVTAVIAAIDALPTVEELDAELTALEDAGDADAVTNWYASRGGEYQDVLAAYNALTEDQQAQVTNGEKLLAMAELWEPSESQTRMITGKLVVYQVLDGTVWKDVGTSAYQTIDGKAYIDTKTAAGFFGNYGYVESRGAQGLQCSYNDIYEIRFMHLNDKGKLVDSGYDMDVSGAKFEAGTELLVYVKNNPPAQRFRIWDSDGYSVITPLNHSDLFVRVKDATDNTTPIYLSSTNDDYSKWVITTSESGISQFASKQSSTAKIDVNNGDYGANPKLWVWAGSQVNWKLIQQYDLKNVTAMDDSNLLKLTDESNGSIVVRYTPTTTVSQLQTINSASTKDLIEINLYDYGDNINEMYDKTGKIAPGFQHELGTTSIENSLSSGSFNFGNNIVAEVGMGKTNITGNATGINRISTENSINIPISGEMSQTLVDGYPALSESNNNISLKYLFTQNTYATKKNTANIDGLFLYNEATGTYSFNSRNNHAQFNEGTDTFTLYRQVITSNFMMYPFGNFLPFNDITKATQASTITRQTFDNTQKRAEEKSNSTTGEMQTAYKNLSTTLTTFIKLMDNAHNSNWSGIDGINDYFSKAGVSKNFTNADLTNIYSINYDDATDFFFGMEMKMNFMQPKGGLTGQDGQQPMVFYFTGDDDVWVYIDGYLFLDLSGIHRHVGGEIDFVKGEVRYYSLDTSTGEVSGVAYKTVKFEEIIGNENVNEKGTFKDYTTHRLNFYYMERGAGSGVCRMNFNFPLLQKNTITVGKELSVSEGELASLLGDPDFKFQILKENGTDLFIPAGTLYDILNQNNEKIGTGVTGENGVITLKAGQMARFSGITEDSGKYFVRELLDEAYYEQYGTITVNGTAQTVDENNNVTVGTDTFKGVNSPIQNMSNGSAIFRFDNNVTINKLGSLSIKKEMESDETSDKDFEFRVTLNDVPLAVGTTYTVGNGSKTVSKEGIITLQAGETATISKILAGTKFEVQEQTTGYVTTYAVGDKTQGRESATGTIGLDTVVSVVVTNSRDLVNVVIPVTKTLAAPDGKEHTFKFQLKQVDEKGTSVEAGVSQTLELTIKDNEVQGKFEKLTYAAEAEGKTFYYKVTEIKENDDFQIGYDETVYTVTVNVTRNAETGRLEAKVSYKAGDKDCENIVFQNWIIRYELPSTGGVGTTGIYLLGSVLVLAAALLLLKKRNRTAF